MPRHARLLLRPLLLAATSCLLWAACGSDPTSPQERFPLAECFPERPCVNRGIGSEDLNGLSQRLEASLPPEPAGIVLYAASMWVTGILEGLMWREVDANGFLVNSFADTVAAKFPMYVVRALGGVMYLSGALIMCYNLWMTVRKAPAKEQSLAAAVPAE